MTTSEGPPPAHGEAVLAPNIQQLSAFAIDQVIVDGIVDGEEGRARMKLLVQITMDGERLEGDAREDFRRALVMDERYKDSKGNSYGFHPILRDPAVRPRPAAIIEGTATCTEDERYAVVARMEGYVLLAYSQNLWQPLSLQQIKHNIVPGGVPLPYREFSGLQAFLRDNPRFTSRQGGIALRRKWPTAAPGSKGSALDEAISAALEKRQLKEDRRRRGA